MLKKFTLAGAVPLRLFFRPLATKLPVQQVSANLCVPGFNAPSVYTIKSLPGRSNKGNSGNKHSVTGLIIQKEVSINIKRLLPNIKGDVP